jgi:prepilin-type N-terminal cleavage/methylation domain-containing protein
MNAACVKSRQAGFTLLELLIATTVFLLICGAIFGLLNLSQKNYGSEVQISSSFQEARLAVDQIVSDFNQSGYPSLAMFSAVPVNTATYAFGPVAWSPGYVTSPPSPCQVGTGGGGTCATPGDFDLITESDTGNGVNWIRYQLVGTTLYRAVVPKVAGVDPTAATSAAAVKVPFIVNVMNNPPAADMAEIMATYPSMYPGGQPVPIFQFTCDAATGTAPCPTAGAANASTNIRDVDVTLIVRTNQRDQQTQKWKLVELNGRGHRSNPTN